MSELARARRPLRYRNGPCEGWQASPSNPAKATKRQLTETVVLRCTAEEKERLKQQAQEAGLTTSALLRATLGLVKPTRRRLTPKADPHLVAELSRMGSNLNQIARALNTARAAGETRQLDGLQIITVLTTIDRQLSELLKLLLSEEPNDAD
ncbi:plasmid mobilization protein [Pseudovibrio sp. WM33]|uniref:plasmid mobilization protein n=1 Tax=Pseudovibrio sp. WM33 TaxID=1735585 RepID=UPI0007B28E77|nr:plasmid mobilization relaxosome protein MobC [Pseudovibrio sp. WM33]KZL28009.1 Bacterial mobilization protein (MobC) [Pseudovibrio sp. WM33]